MKNTKKSTTPSLLAAALILAACSFPAFAADAYDSGYREGYAKGYQDGVNSSRQGYQGGERHRPRHGIAVTKAWYGDDRRSCDLTGWAADNFDGRTSAEVDVTNDICGDPSPGNRKSLHVEYTCHGQGKHDQAFEHRRLSLSCN